MRKNTSSPVKVNGFGVLRSVLEHASSDTGRSLSDLTVLSAAVDPYRLDMLADQIAAGRNDELDSIGHLADAVEDAAGYLHNLKYTNGG
jgi:hypothetical protein